MSGTINIVMPDREESNDAIAVNDKELMESYDKLMETWTLTIKKTIGREMSKRPDPNSALAEIEYWRARSAILSTMH